MKLLDRLKNLIFDESDEIDPSDTQMLKTIRTPSDSLEDNSNLRKTQPIPKPMEASPIFSQKSEPMSAPKVVTKTGDQEKENSLSFMRIDLNPSPVAKTETVKPVRSSSQPLPSWKKPETLTTELNRVNTHVNPQYYKPREVISPIFGVQSKDNRTKTENVKPMVDSYQENREKMLSPMFGEVTGPQTVVAPETPRRVKKEEISSMSLEDMLQMDSHISNDLDYTLFDVPVDDSEFVSREHRILDSSDVFSKVKE